MTNKKNLSILRKVTRTDIVREPYAYAHVRNCLPPYIYDKMAAGFPDVRALFSESHAENDRARAAANNVLLHSNAVQDIRAGMALPQVLVDFVEYHTSQRFFRQALSVMGDAIRETYPGIEDRLGKPLEDLSVAARGDEQMADIRLNVHFAINTAVQEPSRVRARHVDDPTKLFSALLYMRSPDDDSTGGDLEICRWRGPRAFRNSYVEGHNVRNTHVDDEQSVRVALIPYEENALIFFLDSVDAIHGVTERQPTTHQRRYINFVAEMAEPLYDMRDYIAAI